MNEQTPGAIQATPAAQQAAAQGGIGLKRTAERLQGDPIARESTLENARQFITFTLGAQEYGVDIMRVREIKGWSETTALPQAPSYVRGVINLRGIIVPILDLRARFGMGTTVPTRMHVVIIVISDTRTTGLLVDAVSDIITVEPNTIRPVPRMGDLAAEDSFLDGLVPLDDRMVTLVSLDGLIGTVEPGAARTH